MSSDLILPIIDLSSPDRASLAKSIRQACVEYGFFYVINHGIARDVFQKVFEESKKFFTLPLEEKMKLKHNDYHRGYTALYEETLDTSTKYKVLQKEAIQKLISISGLRKVTLESLPFWKATMESYYHDALALAQRLSSLLALSLNLDDQYFEKIGSFVDSPACVRLLYYPGQVSASDTGKYGASAHSDYGIITLLMTDGVPGLQICREKDKCPQLWEDVHHVDGALIVNAGDLLERWTNCLFRSTMHRVLTLGKERYSVAFFLDTNPDCVVECLESCCSEECPPRFPPIRAGDYLKERLRVTYS